MSRRLALVSTFALGLLLAAAKAEPAMWVVKDEDSTIYLIGTVHVLRPEMLWNSEKVTKALADSTELWLEVIGDDDEAALASLIQQYGLDREKPLSKKLNAKQKAKFAEVAKSYGISAASVEAMKPWTIALMLTVLQVQKAGYDPKAGVEQILKAQAQKEGDKIFGLETIEQQVRFFADLPEAEQVAFLDQTLNYAAEGVALLDELAKAWAAGNVDMIGEVLVGQLKSEAPNLYDKLLVQRNIRWTEKIQEILGGSGVHQIAVGAGHLAGPDSVQAQLARRGVKVEPF
ncbi:MAG: TraB/GumN family protein [Chthoniobacterales bacterium]